VNKKAITFWQFSPSLDLGTAYSKIFHVCMDVRWCTILLEDDIYVMIILGVICDSRMFLACLDL